VIVELIDDFGIDYAGETVLRENKVVVVDGHRVAYLPPHAGAALQGFVGYPDEVWEAVRQECEKLAGHAVALPYPYHPKAFEDFLAANGDGESMVEIEEELDEGEES
jgi:hypothetical protein